MNFEILRAEGRLRPHRTSPSEIADLLRVAERDIADAQLAGLSSDRCFLIAYDAALSPATIPLYSFGYETHGVGHHWMTFPAFPHVMGVEYESLATYFDLCRSKRNIGTYDRCGGISDSEASELLQEVERFEPEVEHWLRANHPNLA